MFCKEPSDMIIWSQRCRVDSRKQPNPITEAVGFSGCSYACRHCLTVRCRSNGIIRQTSTLSPHKVSGHLSYNAVRNQRATTCIFSPRIQLPLTSSLNFGLVGVSDDQCSQIYGNNVRSGLMRCPQVSSFVFMCAKRSPSVTPYRTKCWKRRPMGWNWRSSVDCFETKWWMQRSYYSWHVYACPRFYICSHLFVWRHKCMPSISRLFWVLHKVLLHPHPIDFDH